MRDRDTKTWKKNNAKKNREECSVWQKTLAFAHIATTWRNITSVLKLAQFIRSGRRIMASHATRASNISLDHSAGQPKFRDITIQNIASMPANDSNSDT